jgi:hypothetical protein
MSEDAEQQAAYLIGKYPAVNQNTILFARAMAIQSYAHLEQTLSFLFAKWLGAPIDLAGLVFFRITNTHARNRILDDLKEKKIPLPRVSPKQPWLDIFQQPIVYPPPDTHPLSPNYKAPETPPQSSGG